MRGRFRLGLFSSIVFLNGLIPAQQLPPGSAHVQRTLYLAGNRHITFIDLRTNTIKVWDLLTLAGLKESPECSARKPPLSCDWHASQARFEPKNGRIYFVAPAEDPGTGPNSSQDLEREGRKDAVWVLKLGKMERVKKLELPASMESPTILLTPDGKRLLVSYTSNDSTGRQVIDTFDTSTFNKVSTVKDTSDNVLNTYFPAESYFLPNGKMIVAGDNRIRVEPGQFKNEYVDHRSHLPAADRDKLTGFFTTVKDGQTLLKSKAISSLHGRTLESVLNESQTATAFWTVDMETSATSPAVIVSFPAKAMLVGSGDQFAVFEAHFVPQTAEHAPYFSHTGRVAIYDVKSGALAREFQNGELKGEGRLLCSSGDGSVAAYARGTELMILYLQTGQVIRAPRELQDLPQPGYSGDCTFLSE